MSSSSSSLEMSEVELLFQVKERQILESCQVSDESENDDDDDDDDDNDNYFREYDVDEHYV